MSVGLSTAHGHMVAAAATSVSRAHQAAGAAEPQHPSSAGGGALRWAPAHPCVRATPTHAPGINPGTAPLPRAPRERYDARRVRAATVCASTTSASHPPAFSLRGHSLSLRTSGWVRATSTCHRRGVRARTPIYDPPVADCFPACSGREESCGVLASSSGSQFHRDEAAAGEAGEVATWVHTRGYALLATPAQCHSHPLAPPPDMSQRTRC